MVITLRKILFVLAAVAFLVAFLIAAGVWTGNSAAVEPAWRDAGLFLLACGFVAPAHRVADH